MTIWLLKKLGPDAVPWDASDAVVVRAASEKAARALARDHDLLPGEYGHMWLNPERTSCEPVDPDGPDLFLVRHTRYG